MPLDGEAYRFNKSGEALDVSFVQMERYLTAADYAMRQAMSAAFERPEKVGAQIYARDAIGQRYRPSENCTLSTGSCFPRSILMRSPRCERDALPNSSPETREREAVGKVSSIFSDAGGYGWGFNAPAAGRYKIRLKGYSVWVSGGGIGRWISRGRVRKRRRSIGCLSGTGRTRMKSGPAAITSPWESMRELGADTARRCHGLHAEGIRWRDRCATWGGESIRFDAMRLFRTRVNGSDEQYVNPLATKEGMPGYAVQWLEVTGPLEDGHVKSGYELLFGDLPMRRLGAGEKGGVPVDV